MPRSSGIISHWLGVSSVLAILCSLGPLGLALAGSLVICLLIFVFPLQGFLAVLAAKPLVDAFWLVELGTIGGNRVNLQSVIGALVPLSVGIVVVLRGLPWKSGIWKFACLYGVVAALGVLLSPARGAALSDFLRVAFPLIFIALGMLLGTDSRRLVPIACIIALYGLVPAAVGFLEGFGAVDARGGGVQSVVDLVRVRGLYQHPLDIAMRCGTALPFALMVATTVPAGFEKIGCRLWALVLAVATIMTYVRSAIVATLFELVLWAWTARSRVKTGFLVIITVAIVSSLGPVQRVMRTATEPLRSGAAYRFASGRALLFAAQIAGFRDAPISAKVLGRGLHTTALVTLQYSPLSEINPAAADYEEGKVTAHNQLLRVLTESGLIGLASFLVLIVTTALHLMRGGSSVNPIRAQFARATLVALGGACVYSLSATPFDQPAVSWPLWFAVGAACAVSDGPPSSR